MNKNLKIVGTFIIPIQKNESEEDILRRFEQLVEYANAEYSSYVYTIIDNDGNEVLE